MRKPARSALACVLSVIMLLSAVVVAVPLMKSMTIDAVAAPYENTYANALAALQGADDRTADPLRAAQIVAALGTSGVNDGGMPAFTWPNNIHGNNAWTSGALHSSIVTRGENIRQYLNRVQPGLSSLINASTITYFTYPGTANPIATPGANEVIEDFAFSRAGFNWASSRWNFVAGGQFAPTNAAMGTNADGTDKAFTHSQNYTRNVMTALQEYDQNELNLLPHAISLNGTLNIQHTRRMYAPTNTQTSFAMAAGRAESQRDMTIQYIYSNNSNSSNGWRQFGDFLSGLTFNSTENINGYNVRHALNDIFYNNKTSVHGRDISGYDSRTLPDPNEVFTKSVMQLAIAYNADELAVADGVWDAVKEHIKNYMTGVYPGWFETGVDNGVFVSNSDFDLIFNKYFSPSLKQEYNDKLAIALEIRRHLDDDHEGSPEPYGTWLQERNVNPATCTTAGSYDIYCTYEYCDDYISTGVVIAIDATNHGSYGTYDDITLPATCAATGLKNVKCSGCHATRQTGVEVAINPSNHTGNTRDDITLPATCAATGLKDVYCDDCNAPALQTGVEVAKNPGNHTGNTRDDITLPATCAATGLKDVYCDDCNASALQTDIEVAINPGNHTGNTRDDITLPATCVVTGLKDVYCDDCDAPALQTDVEVAIDPDNHDGTTSEAVVTPANCGVDGSKNIVCDDCQVPVQTGIAIPKTGLHTYGEWVVTVQPTFENLGERVRTCSVCGHPDKEDLRFNEIILFVSKTQIALGEMVRVRAELAYPNQGDVIIWSSSDDSIATVDANGNVRFHKTGNVKITATVEGTLASASVNIGTFERLNFWQIIGNFILTIVGYFRALFGM